MKSKFKKFLRENKYLPLSLWNSFELKHGDEKLEEKNIKKIKDEVGNRKGLYAYLKGIRTLYIGKANPLFKRIKSHCLESFQEVSGDTKLKTWHKFFSHKQNKGLVKIFWIEVDEENVRQILEKMLSEVLSPEFEKFKKDLEKK